MSEFEITWARTIVSLSTLEWLSMSIIVPIIVANDEKKAEGIPSPHPKAEDLFPPFQLARGVNYVSPVIIPNPGTWLYPDVFSLPFSPPVSKATTEYELSSFV